MIELINVRKRFENSDKYITNDVSLFLPTGHSLCILGESGEGKSVLLKQIVGLIRPTEGSILIDGIDITKLSDDQINTIYKKCGYVFQFAALLDSLTIEENLLLVLHDVDVNMQKKRIGEILDKVNLPYHIVHKYPNEISGGMKKRIGLARTLLTNPEIIVYDEPTSGLDPINTKIIHELMFKNNKERNITSIVVSHDISIFEYVDFVSFLYKGRIEYTGKADTIWESQDPFIYQFIRGLSQGPIAQ